MGQRLSGEQIATFQRDGVVFPLRILSAAEAAEHRAALEAVEASRAGRLPPAMNAKPHLLLPWLWQLVHHPAILDAVEDLLGPDLLCFGTSFIIKNGPSDRYVTWHQDQTHWGLTEPRAVTAWLALTASTPENGGVRMLPGSNRVVLAHRDNGDGRNMLGRREEVLAEVDEAEAVDVTLAPGEMSLHDPLIVHGSPPNRSAGRRIGFAIRYIPATIGQRDGMRNYATLVRGRDHGRFALEQPPAAPFHPDAVRHHAQSIRHGMAVIFGRPGPGAAPGAPEPGAPEP
ncbi:phytanoyl-CoA dioxygenase family protein [Pseudoroseomonas cervicalis]|uniref:phytanoyl-CoA dioxygenase family protein n=1 Tax=Teichococcus cervicalis TaxID=204525 RepID=UPI0022F177C8|nr:phytanoyl-CoA dioxygenase family protein [Pseudoroseomonas cervicalis]WBV44035.1 phytanoyl-CoA dioxygenase family protein [Pseudoroseomonas cervicalis]